MTVETLVSTMNQKDYSLLDRMRISTDAVVVNQCGIDDYKEINRNGHVIKWLNSSTKGLSISRNLCLRKASADICLLADDDLEYVNNYARIVQNAFEMYPDVGIIRFRVDGIERIFKKYPESVRKIGFIRSLKTSSVELAFKREKIAGLWFDELIGAGAKYCMGEENALLAQCMRRKIKMIFVPITISRLHIVNSSWKNITGERYLISRGAAFEAMGTHFTQLLIIQFALRRHKMFRIPIIQQIKFMRKGRDNYLDDRHKGDEPC